MQILINTRVSNSIKTIGLHKICRQIRIIAHGKKFMSRIESMACEGYPSAPIQYFHAVDDGSWTIGLESCTIRSTCKCECFICYKVEIIISNTTAGKGHFVCRAHAIWLIFHIKGHDLRGLLRGQVCG